MLESDAYKDAVKADMAEAKKMNISSVPAFVFNNKYMISGAQSEEVFMNILNLIWNEEKELQKLELEGLSKNDDSCADGVCMV
ncbi:hypothetical protein GCM10010918_26040 [Paenibacillus radicis (ex Gao et al. 2016)]|uniref:DSBA-like thioredoxin domain-containing protein n=1 Tax=Paenibacillus radicis (ex Gao et al. 2016) TaxID=1737354 RepID=A0A917H6G1_9BACL|nr:hypothetical protein GCM10010918_26040 [Paenibacillus radicis (ex Gao et al. 2016)]